MANYENRRDYFEKIARNYRQYLKLYAYFNNGSYEGATPFDIFYRRFTYFVRYEDPTRVSTSGY